MKAYRTIWISDTHLGTKGCKASFLVDFLKHNTCDTLYLVGDIIDGWRMKSGMFWPQEHTNVVRRILTKAKRGTSVVYIPGNHDDFLRAWLEYHPQFGNIVIQNEAIHTLSDGRKVLVTHGDLFDGITCYAPWLSKLGDHGYGFLLTFNHLFNKVRSKLGYKYWSLSSFVKGKVKSAVNFITSFEQSLAREAKTRGLDGVICGHIHHAEIREIDGILYANDGDWVESCTALVEHHDGRLEIVKWVEISHEQEI
jgi:UDP-2,3-diacylglucosamine pyrophosphatase LpxH